MSESNETNPTVTTTETVEKQPIHPSISHPGEMTHDAAMRIMKKIEDNAAKKKNQPL